MLRTLIILVVSLSLSSCLNYEEELSLNRDGSGEIKLRFVFGKFISYMSTLDDDDEDEFDINVEDMEGVELVEKRNYMRRGKRVVEVHLRFEDIRKLNHFDYEDKSGSNIHINDFFDNIEFDGKRYERLIELDNDPDSDDEVPGFISSMVDIQFNFSVKIEGKEERSWSFDLEDLVSQKELLMVVD